MIYITGDTHIPIDIKKLSAKKFLEQKHLSKNDYVIICGDFGGVWDESNEEKYWIKWLKNKNFTTLFVDGNHENFQKLASLPEIDFCGGSVHKVGEGIYHLKRGEIYTVDNKKIFVFGGASSHDKESRTVGKNWWEEEMPNEKEYKYAQENLSMHNFSVDYVLTHCAPTSLQKAISPEYEVNCLTEYLEKVKNRLQYKKWFFGHYHKDVEIDKKHIAVFDLFHKIN